MGMDDPAVLVLFERSDAGLDRQFPDFDGVFLGADIGENRGSPPLGAEPRSILDLESGQEKGRAEDMAGHFQSKRRYIDKQKLQLDNTEIRHRVARDRRFSSIPLEKGQFNLTWKGRNRRQGKIPPPEGEGVGGRSRL